MYNHAEQKFRPEALHRGIPVVVNLEPLLDGRLTIDFLALFPYVSLVLRQRYCPV